MDCKKYKTWSKKKREAHGKAVRLSLDNVDTQERG